MIAYNSNEGSRHTGVVWFVWYAADSAHALGQLVAIDYSDSTPDVAFTYDRLGCQLTITDVLGTRTNVYSPVDLLEERHPDGTALVRSYDPLGRPVGIALGPDYAVGYGYDEFGRFSTVSVSNGATFTYSYVPNSSLLAGYTNDLGLAVAYEYEPHRDVKTLVSNAWGTNVISTFAYDYDSLGRRTRRIDDGTTTNLFEYNVRSELVSAEMGTNTYSYAYDPIGNRTATIENGLTTTYAANELNQYTALNPTSANPTPFTYDPDGNMTSDGTFLYQYDAANQLTNVTRSSDSANVLSCRYDALGRRVEALREDGTTDRYVYFPGSFLLLAVCDDNNAYKEFYTRGLDLSDTLDGAGGIGGILSCSYASGPVLYHFTDIQGNITALSEYTGHLVSAFCYNPFGQFSNQGDLTRLRHCFSSKEWEASQDLIYYGLRFYHPCTGRWLSRDALSEIGGVNLYSFVVNAPSSFIDPLGLKANQGHREYCVVTAVLTHGYPDDTPLDQIRVPQYLPPTQKWGFWGCYADRYNKQVQDQNKIDFPHVPENQTWPFPGQSQCEIVGNLLEVGKAIKKARDQLCQKACCERVTINIQVDQVNRKAGGMQDNLNNARRLIQSGACPEYINDIEYLPQSQLSPYVCPK